MSEPRSRRAKILKNFQRQLEKIKKADGYAHSVYKVTTNVKSWRDTPEAETPTLYIIDENTRYLYNAGKTLEHEWTIGLFGVMKNKTQLEMEEFIADIEECLFKNVTLYFEDQDLTWNGGLGARTPGPISHLRINDIVTDNQLFSEIEGSQLFKISIIFKYVGCVDNPR